ncbi:helix-turn-helix domain-containing protein [Ferrimonas marina]|uniref:DNA-binding transcriptional regulator, XRE family n=1 Tax=Ferrimonas marina TaxID=299255 RepID=A0A1M5TMX0_9GAMM|nr:helix-turn-helix transcriptional regulator [Ferrimonas marina]SHH52155.1 DNA-binding transcriptional regulator, XRE family [Ferrimonas marina]
MIRGQALQEAIQGVQRQLLLGELSVADALRYLRRDVLKMNQAEFASKVGISKRTLSSLEGGGVDGMSVSTLNQVFKIFDLEVGLVPIRTSVPGLLESGRPIQ